MIRIDWQKAESICGQLLAANKAQVFPYDTQLPQDFIPPEIKADPLVHARFLFYTCHYMRGTIRSDYAVKRLVELWRAEPRFFDPHEVVHMHHLEVYAALKEFLFYQASTITDYWIENSRRLTRHWSGDPRTIFKGIAEPDEMYRRIVNKPLNKGVWRKYKIEKPHEEGFLGFQEKMASMLAYFLMEAGLIEEFRASPAVDFHLIRVLLATEILVVENGHAAGEKLLRYEHISPLGVQVLERYSREHDVSLVELGDALWMVSTALCRRAPGNTTVDRHKGRGGKTTKNPRPLKVDWRKAGHVERYRGSCGSCPVLEACRWHVFSGTYYEEGEFSMRSHIRLPDFLRTQPLLPDLPRYAPRRKGKKNGGKPVRLPRQGVLFESPGE